MATNIQKALMAISIVGIILGAASLTYIMSLQNSFADVSNRLTRLEGAITVGELFPGETDLYLKAKQEGAVIYYSYEGSAVSTPMKNAFEKRYPGVTCTNVGFTTAADFIGRVTTEHNAGQKTFDVVSALDPALYMKQKGWIVPYESVQLDRLVLKNNETPIFNMLLELTIYNKNKLNASEVPKTYEDLTNPKYKGKIDMPTPLAPGRPAELLAMLKQYWNNDTRWSNFVSGLKANEPALESGVGVMTQKIVSGEYSIGFGGLSMDTARALDAGAPLDYARLTPIGAYIGILAINDLAVHPNAARLFAEWRLSIEGQTVFQSVYSVPNRRDVPSPSPGTNQGGVDKWFPGVNITDILIPPQAYLSDSQGWIDNYIKPLWK